MQCRIPMRFTNNITSTNCHWIWNCIVGETWLNAYKFRGDRAYPPFETAGSDCGYVTIPSSRKNGNWSDSLRWGRFVILALTLRTGACWATERTHEFCPFPLWFDIIIGTDTGRSEWVFGPLEVQWSLSRWERSKLIRSISSVLNESSFLSISSRRCRTSSRSMLISIWFSCTNTVSSVIPDEFAGDGLQHWQHSPCTLCLESLRWIRISLFRSFRSKLRCCHESCFSWRSLWTVQTTKQ